MPALHMFPFSLGIEEFALMDGCTQDPVAEQNNAPPLMGVLCTLSHCWCVPQTRSHMNCTLPAVIGELWEPPTSWKFGCFYFFVCPPSTGCVFNPPGGGGGCEHYGYVLSLGFLVDSGPLFPGYSPRGHSPRAHDSYSKGLWNQSLTYFIEEMIAVHGQPFSGL